MEGLRSLKDILNEQKKCRREQLHIRCLAEALSKRPKLSRLIFTWNYSTYNFRYESDTHPQDRPGNARIARHDHILAPHDDIEAQTRIMGQFLVFLSNIGPGSTIKCLTLSLDPVPHELASMVLKTETLLKKLRLVVQFFSGLEKLSLILSVPRMLMPGNTSQDQLQFLSLAILKNSVCSASQLNTLALQLKYFPYTAVTDLSELISKFSSSWLLHYPSWNLFTVYTDQ